LFDLQAFIALLYVRGVYGGMNVYSEMSWDKKWDILFFFNRPCAQTVFEKFLYFCDSPCAQPDQ